MVSAGDRPAGGIIAAGEGSRLRRDGFTAPKPLVEVAGHCLSSRAVSGISRRRASAPRHHRQRADLDCVDRVRQRFPQLAGPLHREDNRVIARELSRGDGHTGSTGACSSRPSTRGAGPRTSRASPRPRRLVRPRPTVLAVTPFVADDKPLLGRPRRRRPCRGARGQRGPVRDRRGCIWCPSTSGA